MLKLNDFLLDWAENFFRSKDAFYKKIKEIERQQNKIIISYADYQETVLAMPQLALADALPDKISIITLNSKENFEALIKSWQQFSSQKGLKIYFINPLSNTEKKWIINPSVHSQICDPASLKQGLLAMFETVDQISQETIIKRL